MNNVYYVMQASQQGIHYPRNQFLFYGWYEEQWWVGDEEEEDELRILYKNNCTVEQREHVIGPAMAPLQDEFISNCSIMADSGIVSILHQAKLDHALASLYIQLYASFYS